MTSASRLPAAQDHDDPAAAGRRLPAGEGPPAPLFRPEVVQRLADQRHGAILLARPLSFALLTTLFVGCAAAVIAFLCCFSTSRKVDIRGTLRPTGGLIHVVSGQGGLVVESRVAEGQAVDAGDVLFVLREAASATLADAHDTIASLLQMRRDSLRQERLQVRQQFDQRIEAARRRAEEAGADIRRIEAQVGLQQHRVDLAASALARYSELARNNFVSPVQAQDKQADLLDQQQRLAELQRTAAASTRDRENALAEAKDLQLQSVRDQQAAQRNVDATEQDLTENDTHREIVVKAPQRGVVTAITAEPGQTFSPNQTLAALLPQGSTLEAELFVPSRAVGFVKPGMPVQIRYEAYSFQKFGQAGGVVHDVSRVAMPREELGAPASPEHDDPLYRVRVRLDRQSVTAYGVEQALRAGAQLDASIVLDRRKLYEWILEPLYTVTGHP